MTASETRYYGDRPVFVFSTPPTPNGDLHLGHLCGPYLGADVFVRFQRMNGAAAWHITGSDDFQSYVAERARRENRSPGQTAARYSAQIAATLKLMDIVPDQYTVTSASDDYQKALRAFFSRLVASGSVTLRTDPALFEADTGDYLFEVRVTGGCPSCGASTSGNLCEECGEPNSCADLTDPRSAVSGRTPGTASITRFSVPLQEFRQVLLAHHRLGRTPARIREVAGRVFDHARDVAVTHPARWGVEPAEPGVPGQVIWPIIDVGYSVLYGIESLGRVLGRDWHADEPQQDWKIVHFFGFDNIFYNSIFIPLLYRLAFPDWSPDIDYNVNEFYSLEGSKFSTSRRHVIWGKDILTPDSVDPLRLYLSLTRPEGRLSNFEQDSYAAFRRDILAGRWQGWLNDLGRRVEQRCDGVAPGPGDRTPEHAAFADRLAARLAGVTGSLRPDGFSLNRAAEHLLGLVEDAALFAGTEEVAARTAGWERQAASAIALELAAASLLAHCAAPVMPRFAGQLAAAIGLAGPDRPDDQAGTAGTAGTNGLARWPQELPLVPPGTRVDLARPVFFSEPGRPC